jgi:hypothetical protein
MTDSPIDDATSFDRPQTRDHAAIKRLAGGLAQFVAMLGMAFGGLVLGLIIASWYATVKSGSIPPAAPHGIGLAPDVGPAISQAGLWIVSLLTGGLVGLVVGLVAGIILTRMLADAYARRANRPGKP